MVAWSDVARRAEQWLLPAECVACRQRVTEQDDPLVCSACRLRWRAIPLPICPTCGEPAPLALTCRICVDWPPEFGQVRSAVRLDSTVRPLVHRFKYQGWWRLADSFAVRMAPLLAEIGEGDLVPVPLAAGRRRTRGFNQAERLAAALGRRTGRRVRPECLARVRETPTQTRLTPEERRANLADAFSARLAGHRPVILVDDVFTTGATLCSAAAALAESGAGRIAAVTFARAELPLADAVSRMGPSHGWRGAS